jgi:hypothetical protein
MIPNGKEKRQFEQLISSGGNVTNWLPRSGSDNLAADLASLSLIPIPCGSPPDQGESYRRCPKSPRN